MTHTRLRVVALVAGSTLALFLSTWLPESPAAASSRSTSAAGRPRFLSPDGHDAGSTCRVQAAPCRTFRHALVVAGAGDTIEVAPGSYAEHDLFDHPVGDHHQVEAR